MALNEQAVREVYKWAERNLRDYGGEWELHNELCDMLKAALAKPPRNCDVGTAEEQDARYNKLCEPLRSCGQCPVYVKAQGVDHCEFVWAQMPCDESEAGNRRAHRA